MFQHDSTVFQIFFILVEVLTREIVELQYRNGASRLLNVCSSVSVSVLL